MGIKANLTEKVIPRIKKIFGKEENPKENKPEFYTTEHVREAIAYLTRFKPIRGELAEVIISALRELVEIKERQFVPQGIPGEGDNYQPLIIDTNNALELAQNFAFRSRFYRFRPETKKNLFVDMDGTLAYWRSDSEIYKDFRGNERAFHTKDIFEEGYYHPNVLPPYMNTVEAIRKIAKENNGIDVYILSSVADKSKTALSDKNLWIDKYLPEIPKERRVFLPWGTKKIDYLNLELSSCNILLDDYTINLQEFTTGNINNIGIKLLNGKNDTHRSWQGARTSEKLVPEMIVSDIKKAFNGHYKSVDRERDL